MRPIILTPYQFIEKVAEDAYGLSVYNLSIDDLHFFDITFDFFMSANGTFYLQFDGDANARYHYVRSGYERTGGAGGAADAQAGGQTQIFFSSAAAWHHSGRLLIHKSGLQNDIVAQWESVSLIDINNFRHENGTGFYRPPGAPSCSVMSIQTTGTIDDFRLDIRKSRFDSWP